MRTLSPYNNFFKIDNGHYFYPKINVTGSNARKVEDKQDEFISTSKENKPKKHNFWYTTAGLLAGVAVFGSLIYLLKSPSKGGRNFSEKCRNFAERMEDKIAHAKTEKLDTFWLEVCNEPIRLLKNCGNFLQYFANITPLKDQYAEKFFKAIKLGKICDITRAFHEKTLLAVHRKIFKTKSSKINDTLNQFSLMLDKAIAKTKDPEKLRQLQEAKESLFSGENSIFGQYQKVYGRSEFNKRLSQYQEDIKNLPHDVQQDLKLSNLKKYRGYITDNHTAKARSKIRKSLTSTRKELSFNLQDLEGDILSTVSDLVSGLRPDDSVTRDFIRSEFKKNLQHYITGKTNEKEAEAFKEVIDQLRKKLKSQNYSEEQMKTFDTYIDAMKTTIGKGDTAGSLQRMVKLTEGILPVEDHNRAKNLARQVGKLIQETGESEMKLYQKLSEVKLGSALTDDAGIIMAGLGGAWAVTSADSKEERVESLIRKGIPFVGGLGTTISCMAMMMPGIQCLGLGLLTAYAANLISGGFANKYIMAVHKHKEQDLALQEYYKIKAQNNA